MVISHAPVQVEWDSTTIFNQFVALFVNPVRSKNVRSIVLKLPLRHRKTPKA
jgi:hypothetical protein